MGVLSVDMTKKEYEAVVAVLDASTHFDLMVCDKALTDGKARTLHEKAMQVLKRMKFGL